MLGVAVPHSQMQSFTTNGPEARLRTSRLSPDQPAGRVREGRDGREGRLGSRAFLVSRRIFLGPRKETARGLTADVRGQSWRAEQA